MPAYFETGQKTLESDKLNGLTFVVEWCFSSPERRNELKNIIEANGGKVASSVSAKPTFAVGRYRTCKTSGGGKLG